MPPTPPPTSTPTSTAMSQLNRSAQLVTPLGEGVLNCVRFDGSEGLSELFEFTIDAVAEKVPINFDPLIGETMMLMLQGKGIGALSGERIRERDPDDRTRDPNDPRDDREERGSLGVAIPPRQFSGILTEVRWLGVDNDSYIYRLTLRPWLWLLSHVADCRIYHEKDVPTIIKDVFTRRGFTDFDVRLTAEYEKHEYVVQYRETDLDFVLRMMEEEGIYFYFEHKDGLHVLVLCDGSTAHKPVPEAAAVMYLPRLVSGRSDVGSIYEISSVRRFQFGKVTLNDYDYLKPSTRMLRDYARPAPHTRGQFEIYDYPGRYVNPSAGEKLARVILEAEQSTDKRRHAVGDIVHMLPGAVTALFNHPEPAENIRYLIVRCLHSFEAQAYRSVAATQDSEPYSGSYELLPADVAFRAPRITRRPRVYGPQTAKVVGPEGEEIYVDKHGRIKVRFFWDRLEDCSRWVRIAQTWAGKKWGSIVIPRIGMEVVVEFLEGDPDQPLVTGCVYNAEMVPPYELAANKTKSGFKSNSSPGGGGFNELMFEDKKGEECIELHAQKDIKIKVLDSETKEVGSKYTGSGASRATVLKLGDDSLKLDTGSQKVDVKVNQEVKAGQKITLEADMQIQFKVGGSTITMTQTEIKIEAGGTLDVKAPGKASIDGGGMMTLKAGIININ